MSRRNPAVRTGGRLRTLFGVPVLLIAILIAALLSPLFLIAIVNRRVQGWRLRRRWEIEHGRHGRRVLIVYSRSPNWAEYVESNLLPRLGDYAVTLNWSDREELGRSRPLEWRVFEQWRPEVGFNPLAIVMHPHSPPEVISFTQAFRDARHGKRGSLDLAEDRLFTAVSHQSPTNARH